MSLPCPPEAARRSSATQSPSLGSPHRKAFLKMIATLKNAVQELSLETNKIPIETIEAYRSTIEPARRTLNRFGERLDAND